MKVNSKCLDNAIRFGLNPTIKDQYEKADGFKLVDSKILEVGRWTIYTQYIFEKQINGDFNYYKVCRSEGATESVIGSDSWVEDFVGFIDVELVEVVKKEVKTIEWVVK